MLQVLYQSVESSRRGSLTPTVFGFYRFTYDGRRWSKGDLGGELGEIARGACRGRAIREKNWGWFP